MRFLLSLLGGLLVTIAVFLFMQSLIKSRQQQDIVLPLHSVVEILREEPPELKPESQEEPEPEEPPEEPLMDSVAESLSAAPSTPQPAADIEMPALDLALGEIRIQAAGERWNGPIGAGGSGLGAVNLQGGGGEDAQGFIEVVPYDTRRPNVPDVAYQNKVNGWVLVTFRVTDQGTTRDVRVLDANPRGVFEEKVVAAVSDWRYKVNFYGGATGSVALTQKVEVRWENYPQNMTNVD
jgi:protein TonB